MKYQKNSDKIVYYPYLYHLCWFKWSYLTSIHILIQMLIFILLIISSFNQKRIQKENIKIIAIIHIFWLDAFYFFISPLIRILFCISPSQLSPDPTIHIEPCLLGEMYWNRRFIMKDRSLQKESDSACWRSTRITSSVPRTITGRRSSFRTLGERQLLRIQMNSIIKWSPTTGYV